MAANANLFTDLAYADLPADLTARPAQRDDLKAVTGLINVCAIAENGRPAQNEAETLNDWGTPGFDLATDTRVVSAPDGQLVSYSELWNINDPRVQSFLYMVVHPDFREQGIEEYLLHEGEARAREFIPSVPAKARVTLRTGFDARREDRKAIVERAGYEHVRSFLRMRIDMDAAPPAPVWPNGITVRALRDMEDDFHAAYLANEDAFQDHWGYMPISLDKWQHWLENDPDFDQTLLFVAVTDGPDGEEIVGTCFCRPKITEDPDMGWVADLGVRRQWRRQGIAQALLRHCFGEFWRRGQRKVGLGVDATSLTGASRLYEKVGMRPYRRFDSYLKELRPGVDLSTQTLDE